MPRKNAIDESVSEAIAAQPPIARKDDESATKRAIIHEWENWSALHPDELDDPGAGKHFFRHLSSDGKFRSGSLFSLQMAKKMLSGTGVVQLIGMQGRPVFPFVNDCAFGGALIIVACNRRLRRDSLRNAPHRWRLAWACRHPWMPDASRATVAVGCFWRGPQRLHAFRN